MPRTALFFTKSINKASPTRYGTVLQMKNLLFNMMVFQTMARSYGADWEDSAGKITVDSPAYRTSLELYKKLYDAGASPKDSLSYDICRGQCRLRRRPGGHHAAMECRGRRPR